MNTWRTLLPHELDDIEKKIEAGEALDVGLLRSLVTMARRMEVAVGEYERGCTHPEEHLETFRWEHDNGSWKEGLRCTLCRAECRYPTPMGKWRTGYDDGIES